MNNYYKYNNYYMLRNINILILGADNDSIWEQKGVKIVLDCIKTLEKNKKLSSVKNWDVINFYYTDDKLSPKLNEFFFDDSLTIDGKKITITYKVLPEEFLNLRDLNIEKLIKLIPNRFQFILNENCPRADFGIRSNHLYKIINELLVLDGYYIDKHSAIEYFSQTGYDSIYKNQIELIKKDVNISGLKSDNIWSIFKLRKQDNETFDEELKLAIELSKQTAGKRKKSHKRKKSYKRKKSHKIKKFKSHKKSLKRKKV